MCVDSIFFKKKSFSFPCPVLTLTFSLPNSLLLPLSNTFVDKKMQNKVILYVHPGGRQSLAATAAT